MKGYVKIEVDENVINKMKEAINKCKDYIDNYNVKDYHTPIYRKKYIFFGEKYVSHYAVAPLFNLPKGLRWSYKMKYDSDSIAIRYIGHEFDYLPRAKGILKILELSSLNNEIMIDDELAEIYNSYVNKD